MEPLLEVAWSSKQKSLGHLEKEDSALAYDGLLRVCDEQADSHIGGSNQPSAEGGDRQHQPGSVHLISFYRVIL